MSLRKVRVVLLGIGALAILSIFPVTAVAVPEAITYQGYLTDAEGKPVNGDVAIAFRIWDAEVGGTDLWAETHAPVTVTEGVFNVILGTYIPITAGIVGGECYLGVTVGTDSEMVPRTKVSSSAYAIRAGYAESVAIGAVTTSSLSDTAVTETKIALGAVSTAKLASASVTSEKVALGAVSTAKIASGAVSTDKIAFEAVTGAKVAAGTLTSSHLQDGTALEEILDDDGPGSGLNADMLDGQDAASFSQVGHAHTGAEITGKVADADKLDGLDSSAFSTSGHNHDGSYWRLSGNSGTNQNNDFIGTTDNQILVFRVNDAMALRIVPDTTSPSLIGGYFGNWISPGVLGATIGGGGVNGFNNRVTDNHGTVGGGQGNQAGDNAGTVSDRLYATVSGGASNTAGGQYATVGGGYLNSASLQYATVGGGGDNSASQGAATVAGGYNNTAGGTYATVGGGTVNTASSDRATVGGGAGNNATGSYATVSGGASNTASGSGDFVGGGDNNTAGGWYSVVGGGHRNETSGEWATVGGGQWNTASGDWATVPGGSMNLAAGENSFAAGNGAKARGKGAFRWADSTPADFDIAGSNDFRIRASGGVVLYTSGDLSSGVWVGSGGSAWNTVSDRNAKDNFTPIDGREVLTRLAAIPITVWNYKSQDPSIRHMGPVAQDFSAAFGLGESDRHISTIDADGVALAAIQGLHKLVQEKDGRISTLEEQNRELETRLAVLEDLVQTLAKQRSRGEQ
jgi:hypothetical protein